MRIEYGREYVGEEEVTLLVWVWMEVCLSGGPLFSFGIGS